MSPRLHVDRPLHPGATLTLPATAARHVQVLRLQPGSVLCLFNGAGGEWSAQVTRIGRDAVDVEVGEHVAIERELPIGVTLALGMPANERMDDLVEKATELGAAAIQPLVCARSVLRLEGERAQRRWLRWHAIVVAACEQSGRNRLPEIHPVRRLDAWLAALPDDPGGADRLLLSPQAPAAAAPPARRDTVCLSGPEGGLDAAEEALALKRGFRCWSLGARVLRADTAPLALLAGLAWPGRGA